MGIVPLKASVYLCDLNDRNDAERRQHAFRAEVVFGVVTYDDGSDEDLCECRICGRQYSRHKLVGRGDDHGTGKGGMKMFGGIVCLATV